MKEKRKEFLTLSKATSRQSHKSRETRKQTFLRNLDSHPHWTRHITSFLGPSQTQAKIDLITIVRTNDSAINLKGRSYDPTKQRMIKNRLVPDLLGKFLSNHFFTISSDTNYIIDFSNMRITIIFNETNIELKTQLDNLCTILRDASGKRKRYKFKKINI
jgi:hypothetical protein